ncbi:MAG: chemotaxis protein CheW, partial [Arcobacteraceae bacterium]|nr:chemotaxis protein CheW [Arcobacteraceae bacterium]
NGKSSKGTVWLRAYADSGYIVIEIEDDGAGINKEAVLKKAVENGVVDEHHNLTDKEIYKLIFAAGLSTAKEVSAISGRGVGMDVVKRNIEDLRGVIDVDSVIGKGSKITIRLPLTLAVIDGFLVQAGDTKYIIPLSDISECIELTDEYKNTTKGSCTINVRGKILPLLDIRKTFNEKVVDNIRQNVVLVNYASYKVGLQVDELYGEQQTVIKPLGDMFGNIDELSGGAILGSGEVALILNIPKLIENQISKGE